MSTCWAEKLGGCSDKTSREHIVSAGIFPEGEPLRVKGFPWCRNEFKEIGMPSFTRKILCERHNNYLTHTDEAGIKAMNVFRQEIEINDARVKMKPRRWTVKTFSIDGRGFESWLLKTLINVSTEGIYRIGRDSTEAGKPSERLVRIAFGLETFKSRAGVYGLGNVGQKLKLLEGIFLCPLVQSDESLTGGLFHFRGYRFLLYFEEEGLSRNIPLPTAFGEQAHRSDTMYPLEAIRYEIGKHLSHIIKFRYTSPSHLTA